MRLTYLIKNKPKRILFLIICAQFALDFCLKRKTLSEIDNQQVLISDHWFCDVSIKKTSFIQGASHEFSIHKNRVNT